MNSNRWIDAVYGLAGIPRETMEEYQRVKKSLGSFSVKKIFPKLGEKVEPHTDENQRVVYEEDEHGKTVTTLL